MRRRSKQNLRDASTRPRTAPPLVGVPRLRVLRQAENRYDRLAAQHRRLSLGLRRQAPKSGRCAP